MMRIIRTAVSSAKTSAATNMIAIGQVSAGAISGPED